MEEITPSEKLTKENPAYILEPKDFLLIQAIRDLTIEIRKSRMNR